MKKSRRSLDDDASQSDDDDQFDSRGRPGISKPKHSQDSVTILETWLNSNLHKPYPTKDEKQYLMEQTGLRIKQIESWMEKQRRKRGVQKICHYTPEAKSILQNWFNANEANPYPTSDEKNDLSVQTGLTIAQISSYMEKTRAKRGLKRKSLGKSTTTGDAAASSNKQDEDSPEKEVEDDSNQKHPSIAVVKNIGNGATVTPVETKRGLCSSSVAKSQLESKMLQPVETKTQEDKLRDHDQDEDSLKKEVEDDSNPKDLSIGEVKNTDGEANVTPARTKRGVCSPSVAKSLDKLESKMLQRTEDSSLVLSTVSSLGFGDPLEYRSTQIPTEIIIRRRFHTCSFAPEDNAMSITEISDDAGGTPLTNGASTNCADHKQSSNNAAHATGEDRYIDLCDSSDDQTVSYHGEKGKSGQVEIIDVDAPEEQQITSRKLSTMNEVTMLY